MTTPSLPSFDRPLTIHLVRHGEVALNEGDRVYGDMEMPLSDRGRRQLEAVGEAFASRPIVAVCCSNLERAQIGAAAIATKHHSIEPRVDPNLREIFRGEWRNLTWAEIEARWPGGPRKFVEEPATYRDHHGETLADVDRRALAAFAAILEVVKGIPREGKGTEPEVAVVSHSWIVRCLLARALTSPLTAAMGLPVDTGSIQSLRWTGDGWRLLCVNRRPASRTPRPEPSAPSPTG